MENNKLFGLDGFIKEFYSMFSFIFFDFLVYVVNLVFKEGYLFDI